MLDIINKTKIDYRPKLHFTPKQNWINDPNGLVYFDGEWHLFFQYNPYGNEWGHMHWGHAVSKDLLNWEELPIAIHEDEEYMIFSGSCVIDWNNTSGLGDGKNPPMIAIYTGSAQNWEKQVQCLAISHDKGRTFTKYANNPVLDIGKKDFRDPKVFWHEETKKWIMVIANSTENTISIYSSKNLISWELQSNFGPAGSGGNLWECPDLFPLKVDETDEIKWVLKVDIFEREFEKYSMAQVFIGDFDGKNFECEKDENDEFKWQRADYGHDFYAAISWSDVPKDDGRRIWLGWMNSHHYCKDTPTLPWRGAMTLPRVVSLRRITNSYHIVQTPIHEIQALDKSAVALNTYKNIEKNSHEFFIEVKKLSVNDAIFALNFEEGEKIIFGYDAENNSLFIDRSNSGFLSERVEFGAKQSAPRILDCDNLKIHFIIDTCSIELFFDDGLIVFSEVFYTKSPKFKIECLSPIIAKITACALGVHK